MARHTGFALAGVLVVSLTSGRAEEPKRLSSRDRAVITALIADLDNGDAKARRDALRALTWIGPPARDALPRLLALTEREDVATAEAARSAILEIGTDDPRVGPALAAALGDTDAAVRIKAMATVEFYLGSQVKSGGFPADQVMETLGKLGPAGPRIIPAIIANLAHHDPRVRKAAVGILAAIGTPARQAVEPLIARLDDTSAEVRAGALPALVRVGPASPAVVPALLNVIRTGEPPVQRAARHVLEGRFEPGGGIEKANAVADLPPLIAALGDPEVSVRATAATCLWLIRAQTAPAHAALRRALDDPDTEVQLLAAAVLIASRPQDPKAEAILVAALPDLGGAGLKLTSIGFTEFYADVVRNLGSKGVQEIPRLVSHVLVSRTQSARPQISAARALGGLGDLAVPDLIRVVKGSDREARRQAARVLAVMGPLASASAPEFVALLDSDDLRLASTAAYGLEQFGRAARDVIPLLEPRLQSPDFSKRLTAVGILSKVDPGSGLLMPVLENLLKNDDRQIREGALWRLGFMGPRAVPLLESAFRKRATSHERVLIYRALAAIDANVTLADSLLRQRLEDRNVEVRLRAIEVATELGPEAKGCLGTLVHALDDADGRVAFSAEYAVNAVDKGNARLVAHLISVWSTNASPEERRRAARLLGACGEKASRAIPVLKASLDREVGDVQAAAAAALAAIDFTEVPIYLVPTALRGDDNGFR